MAKEITMPKLSDTMEEGTILKWHIQEGDEISEGDVIAEVETDKAAMEMEAFEDGVVSAIKVKEGETVSVGTVIAELGGSRGKAGEEAEEEPEKEQKQKKEKKKEKEKEKEKAKEEKGEEAGKKEADKEQGPDEADKEQEPVEKEAGEETERPEPEEEPEEEEKEKTEEREKEEEKRPSSLGRGVTVAPAARRLAREEGIDLARVRGTGPGGRITPRDVERTAEQRQEEKAARRERRPSPPAEKEKKSVKIRRIVARKMVESWQNAPHFYVTVAVDMTDVIRFRKDVGVSINDFILAATARSLGEHPWVNSHWQDGEAVEQPQVNIAMAVATDRGLYNPVIRDCGRLSLREVHRRAGELAEKAHQGKLEGSDLEGGTFTISNMGMLGVESFCAIITPPQAAVLAVGTVKGEVVVKEDEEPGIAPILRLTLSADHRMLDGADAAEFLATLKSYLEAPITLITGESGR